MREAARDLAVDAAVLAAYAAAANPALTGFADGKFFVCQNGVSHSAVLL